MNGVYAILIGLIVFSPFIYNLITDLINDYKKTKCEHCGGLYPEEITKCGQKVCWECLQYCDDEIN
jgi:hypothetical protein